ncbi:flavodoxin family protein [Bacillus wiedmannii]|uniref:flavodoxin family protein n=1 Tax=Bacillus wiedmannii TaxID=1890302 RepID=UPI000BF0CF25|nr:flavodoxin domain-containing protein [Bacillus wiedmannii]PEN61653.1 flavodoxin [Bacillus wiedmannii]PHA62897.1 flavodoxin [Bacillus wiedmannii]
MGILLVLASNTGNTKTFVDFLKNHSNQDVEVCTDFSASIEEYSQIAFGSYTWGDGKIPTKMKDYLIENKNHLKNKEVFIFGSGNSVYAKFCAAVDGMEKICTDCGANVTYTYKFEQRFNEEDLLPSERSNLVIAIGHWSSNWRKSL